MIGSGAKKHRKFKETDSSLLVLYFHFFTPCFTSHHSLLSEHLDQDTDLGEPFQINLSILSSDQINQFILSSKALSCMVP